MIKRWMVWLATALVSALAACGGGGGSPGANPNDGALSVGAVTALTLMPGEARTLPVSGGVPPYRVVSAERAIAVAALEGSQLIIGGQNAGETRVTVADRAGNTVGLTVKVGSSIPLYTTAPATLQLGVGPSEARTFRVAGGVKPYVITGNAPLVAAVTQLDAEQWRIQGVAIGNMQVRIRDAAGTELEVAVTVGSPELRVSVGSISLPIGVPSTVILSGGQPPYRIAGGIPSAVQVKRLTDNEFEIVGWLVTGGVDVVFADATGKTVTTNVTVVARNTQIAISPSQLRVAEASGTQVKFQVRTGARGPLVVLSSRPGLVAVSGVTAPTINSDGTEFGSFIGTVGASACVGADTDVELTAIDAAGSVGTATVTVLDLGDVCGEVEPPETNFAVLAPPTLNLPLGGVRTYTITGGTLPLVAVAGNPQVLEASIIGDGRTLRLRGLAAGSSTVFVYDALGNTASGINTVNVIAVDSGETVALATFPSSATGAVGDTLRFVVAGGTAPYTLTINNPAVAAVSPTSIGSSGGEFVATLLNAGSTVVTVRDAKGETVSVQLTAGAGTPNLRVSPSTLELAERTIVTPLHIDVNIYGGVGPYRVFSSDTSLIEVGDGTTFGNNTPIVGSTFTIRQLGSRDVSDDREVIVTVIDSTGASATSQIKIKNNN
ncbi:pilus assembly protein N-terminal domain-containing protein [Tepidimonas charontis]|uniref:Uncharacterized protein n=1 Tax=Tepidimonas charontis TaxID=2267262 RepID=A0A554XJK3_9BURK|nr:pilus assembly protein N-terminal domain-containing protein [Tepidimonas charontis]TSE35978.1 hypothetical protein Tchar_00333 [Tepidimonas charontis]